LCDTRFADAGDDYRLRVLPFYAGMDNPKIASELRKSCCRRLVACDEDYQLSSSLACSILSASHIISDGGDKCLIRFGHVTSIVKGALSITKHFATDGVASLMSLKVMHIFEWVVGDSYASVEDLSLQKSLRVSFFSDL
jgi:hypothetical protein